LLDRCSPVGATPFQSPQWLSVAELSGFRQSLIFPVMIQKPFTSRHLIMTAVCQCSVLSVIYEGNPSDKICLMADALMMPFELLHAAAF
jgi:hypothetical protein